LTVARRPVAEIPRCAAVDAVVPAVAEEFVAAAVAADEIGLRAAFDAVIAAVAVARVIAVFAENLIGAVASPEQIPARAAMDAIVAGPAKYRVVSVAPAKSGLQCGVVGDRVI